MNSGIYKITNTYSGKIYIGSSRNVFKRMTEHKSLLRRGAHVNKELQKDWNNYGESVFDFSVAELAEIGKLGQKEFEYIKLFSKKCYNKPMSKLQESQMKISRPVVNEEHDYILNLAKPLWDRLQIARNGISNSIVIGAAVMHFLTLAGKEREMIIRDYLAMQKASSK